MYKQHYFSIKLKALLIIFIAFGLEACGDAISKKEYKNPEIRWKPLFQAVDSLQIFENSKIFADAIPKFDEKQILEELSLLKPFQKDSLKKFVFKNFTIDTSQENSRASNLKDYLDQYYLKNNIKSHEDGGSLIPTRKNYLSGGQGFKEFNYWNAYFAMLGMAKNDSLLDYSLVNCAQFIQDFGFVPQGNRSYQMHRSNPPMFAMMLELFCKKRGDTKILVQMIPQLTKEYQYWMSAENKDEVDAQNKAKGAYKKVVLLPNHQILNRYFVAQSTPRTEFYRQDKKLKNSAALQNAQAMSEAAWSDATRWGNDGAVLNILPVDLNALMYQLEKTLAKAYSLKGQKVYAKSFEELAAKRKAIFNKYFWNENQSFYFDYNLKTQKQNNQKTLAGVLPLAVGLADKHQAESIANILAHEFLSKQGLTEMDKAAMSTAQWQYLAYKGLRNYQKTDLAQKIKTNWLKTNNDYFIKNHAIRAKYGLETKNIKTERLDGAVGVLRSFMGGIN